MQYKLGDTVLLQQTKSTTRPPYDPDPFTIKHMQGSAITATRRGKVVTRDVDKWKIVKERPNYFRTHTYYRTPTPNLQVSTDQSEDDDDFDLPKAEAPPSRQ